jgi:hypothetical protein
MMIMNAEPGRAGRSRRPANAVLRQALLLPAVLVLPGLATELRFFWRRVLHSYVQEYDSYGLNLFGTVLVGICAGLAAWAVCWFLIRSRRGLLVGQVVTLLVGPLVIQGLVIGEARAHPGAQHEAEVAQQVAAERAAAAGVAAYWNDLPAWLGTLPAGAVPYLPPVPDGQGISWRGTSYPAGQPPDRGTRFAVVTGSPSQVVVLAEHGRSGSGPMDLLALPVRGPQRLLAENVLGATAAPDGQGYAYSTTARVTAQLAGAAAPVTLLITDVVLRGWGSDGVVLQAGDGTLLRWQPERPTLPVTTLVISTGTVQVPPRGHRMLQRACLQRYDAVGVTNTGQPEPYVGFQGGVWPVTLPAQTGTNPDACPEAGRQSVLTARGTIELAGQTALSLSPDGRYLLQADLQALDLDTGTRTSVVGAATREMLLRIAKGFPADPIGTGFWHDDRTVEITAGGSPVAVCTLPTGPCRSTGTPLPRMR